MEFIIERKGVEGEQKRGKEGKKEGGRGKREKEREEESERERERQ